MNIKEPLKNIQYLETKFWTKSGVENWVLKKTKPIEEILK